MHFFRPGRLLLFVLFLCASTSAQQPTSTTVTTSDPQAVALLQESVSAFGSLPPLDSRANGNVTITAGSLTTQGAVTILTKGTAETSIQFQMSNSTWSVIYSNGQANRVESGTATVLPLELAASSQCLYFPLPYLAGLLGNPNVVLSFVGQEAIDSTTANHIRVQNTFASSPAFQSLAEFNTADVWLDATTALPVRISMIRRYAGGASPKIPVSVVYSNYQVVSGVRCPFSIQEYVTQTLWATTTIDSVSFNTGLTDANFPVTQEGN